jgi:hypothetical protein
MSERWSLRLADPLLDACRLGTATLYADMAGPAVAKVQQALMELRYVLRDHGPDGVFGPETGAAVAAFNAGNRLEAMPVVDSQTVAALAALIAVGPPEAPECPTNAAGESTLAAVNNGMSSALPATEKVVSRAVDLALAQAAQGAHFLTGSAGARPGGTGRSGMGPGGVTVTPGRADAADPAVFAAMCGRHVCAGRFNAQNGGIAGGRPAGPTDTDLIVYLAGLAAVPEQQWKPFFQFFSPRRIEGGMLGSQVVWGEDCRAKRHFDGAGLVNWCLGQAAEDHYELTFDLDTWSTDANGTEPVGIAEPPRRGDIVLRHLDGVFTHIGLLVADTEPGVADLGHVVLAEQPGVGVVVRRFTPAGWSVRRRLLGAVLQ